MPSSSGLGCVGEVGCGLEAITPVLWLGVVVLPVVVVVVVAELLLSATVEARSVRLQAQPM